MKKLLTVFLAVVMLFTLGTAVFASSESVDLTSLQNEEDGSALEPILTTAFTGTTLAYPRYANFVNEDASGELSDDISWHNGAIYTEGTHTVSGASFEMNTTADGSDTNDFSGLGAAVMVANAGSVLEVSDSTIETTGVAKLALFTVDGALSIVRNSTLISNSGTVYDGYMSTADQSIMVAPPWVLGLGGDLCNARTTNLMGDYSVAVYIDSDFQAAGWGALSTDSGTNMHMVVINTSVEVGDSGYGAYTIGETTEDYYGVTEDVSTYVNIMTGGVSTYQSYVGGTEIDVEQYNGTTDEYGFGASGEIVATVSSDAVADGEVVTSVLNSDEFGFMCHANGSSGYNVVNILDGTEVNTGDAIFLVKKINSIFNVDNAILNSGTGVLLQIIDNDDDYVGVDPSVVWGEDNGYGHANSTHMPTFNETFHEEDGYSNEFAVNETDVSENWTSELNLTNTTVEGDVWNSTGYVGSNPATTLTVNLGEGADLTGVISAGAFSHTTKDASVGDGDWNEASVLGHVTNIVNSNGKNIVNVVLTDDAVWTVGNDSVIDSLEVSDNAQVVVPAGVTLTVAGETYTDTVIGGASGEASAEASSEAAGGDTSEAAYQAYLKSYVDACPAVTDEQYEEFAALIDAGDYVSFPVEMCFTDAYWGFTAATYDEFVAAGGNVELPAFDAGLTADA